MRRELGGLIFESPGWWPLGVMMGIPWYEDLESTLSPTVTWDMSNEVHPYECKD